MRLVIATCTVDYVGRLTAHLPSATRLILVKADGSVSVHADDRAYKPLNWMSPPCTLAEGDGTWTVTNKAGERLVITLEEVLHDSRHELGVDPGLVKDGVEAHLQALLADQIETLGTGWRLVRREYPTAIGPVDILAKDDAGGTVAIEIKRRGEIDGVEQLTRYLELLNRDSAAGAGARRLRRPGDQAAGQGAGPRPRHRLRDARLRRAARLRRRRLPPLLRPPTSAGPHACDRLEPCGSSWSVPGSSG